MASITLVSLMMKHKISRLTLENITTLGLQILKAEEQDNYIKAAEVRSQLLDILPIKICDRVMQDEEEFEVVDIWYGHNSIFRGCLVKIKNNNYEKTTILGKFITL